MFHATQENPSNNSIPQRESILHRSIYYDRITSIISRLILRPRSCRIVLTIDQRLFPLIRNVTRQAKLILKSQHLEKTIIVLEIQVIKSINSVKKHDSPHNIKPLFQHHVHILSQPISKRIIPIEIKRCSINCSVNHACLDE